MDKQSAFVQISSKSDYSDFQRGKKDNTTGQGLLKSLFLVNFY